jgi:hypothetical protein
MKIKEAIARGEFDNLPGKDKPLDLDAYFATPEHLRMGYSILKSADYGDFCLPPFLGVCRGSKFIPDERDARGRGRANRDGTALGVPGVFFRSWERLFAMEMPSMRKPHPRCTSPGPGTHTPVTGIPGNPVTRPAYHSAMVVSVSTLTYSHCV